MRFHHPEAHCDPVVLGWMNAEPFVRVRSEDIDGLELNIMREIKEGEEPIEALMSMIYEFGYERGKAGLDE